MMVSLDSARQWYPREQLIACDADHSQIAKLKRGESGIYPDIKRAIRQAMLSVNDLYSEADHHDIIGSASVVKQTIEAMRTPGKNFDHQQSEPLEQRLICPPAEQSKSEIEIPANADVSQSPSGLIDQQSPGAYTQESPSIFSETTKASLDSGVHEDQDGLSRLSPANEKKCTLYDWRLKAAIIGGDLKRTHELLSKIYDINCTDEDGRTPLHDAAQWRAELIVEYLLQHGALSRAKTTSGDTSLHCISDDKENKIPLTESLIDILLKYRPPVEEPNKEGKTPLMAAASKGQLLMARKLIDHGARVDKTDNLGKSGLHYATGAFNAPEMITLLIREGAVIDSKAHENFTPLHFAVYRNGDAVEAARCLLEAGANIEAKTVSRTTPLGLAAFENNAACAELLLEFGANIEAENSKGDTSLHISVHKDDISIARLLLARGANIEAKNVYGMTPLCLAAKKNNAACAELLLELGANIEAEYWQLKTPLHVAVVEGNFSIAKLLLAHGANPLARNEDGDTVRQTCKRGKLYTDVTKTPDTELQDMRNVLKEAEAEWKKSGKRYRKWPFG